MSLLRESPEPTQKIDSRSVLSQYNAVVNKETIRGKLIDKINQLEYEPGLQQVQEHGESLSFECLGYGRMVEWNRGKVCATTGSSWT